MGEEKRKKYTGQKSVHRNEETGLRLKGFFFFFFKQKTAYEVMPSVVGSEMCIGGRACSEQGRGWVPRCDLASWLGLMHEVEVLRLPLAFGRAHADVTLSENGAMATRNVSGGSYRTAASTVVMLSVIHI